MDVAGGLQPDVAGLQRATAVVGGLRTAGGASSLEVDNVGHGRWEDLRRAGLAAGLAAAEGGRPTVATRG